MGDGDTRNLAGPASGLLLVAALVAGWLWIPSPMRSFRPETPAARTLQSTNDEDVPARLWEDPFSALERGRAAAVAGDVEGAKGRHRVTGTSGLHDQLQRRLDADGSGMSSEPEMTVLAVMVEGGWYAEPVEERRKQRQAVVSALGLRGLVPESADRIGVTIAVKDGVSKADAASGQALEVPFEWFERVRDTKDPPAAPREVLVLWVEEGRCGSGPSGSVRPLGRLAELIDRLLDRAADLGSGRVRLVVLGPATSTTLLAMLSSGPDAAAGSADGSPLAYADFISTRATAPIDLLCARAGVPYGGGEDSAAPLAGQPPREAPASADAGWLARRLGVRSFTSTLADDRAVVRTILRELERRGVELATQSTWIALIGEWDTAYARTLGELVQEEIIELTNGKVSGSGGPAQVESFRYLRGVDGKLPGETPQHSANQPAGDSTTSLPSERDRVAAMERPEGRSQLDAIQRLSERLKLRQRELNRNGERIAAIGVVGSDLYDKQLILQALRPGFADLVFFTTDLDARLIHPSQYPWAHNLVIGSAYGLELREDLLASFHWRVPPFRSVYQTSTFVGCLLGVPRPGGPIPDPEMAERVRNGAAAPRLFEVARTGAWDLSEADPGKRPLHPDPPAKAPFGPTAVWLAFAMVVAVLVASSPRLIRRVSPHCWEADGRERVQLRFARWLLVAAAVVLARVIWISVKDVGGEPFAFLEGISIWPTEMLRFMAGVFSVVALIHAAGDLRQLHRRLAARYGLAESPVDSDDDTTSASWGWLRRLPWLDGWLGLLSRLERWVRRTPWLDRWQRRLSRLGRWLWLSTWRPDDAESCDDNDPDHTIPVADLWRDYLHYSRPRLRWVRVMIGFIGLVGLLLWMMHVLRPPVVPVRGTFAARADSVILVASVLCVWLLTLWVFDVTRLSERLVGWFATRATDWPPAAVERIRAETGLDGYEGSEVLEVRLIAEHTDVASRLVVLPFVAVFLMIVSRASLFDGWTWPLAIVAVFAILFGFCLGSAVMLRLAAERARRATLSSLRRRQVALVSDESKEAARRSRQIEIAIKSVEGIRQGAFARWSQHPILRAVMLPFGGAGALWAMDLLSKLGF